MEVENQVSFISPMLQNTQFGNVDDETTITFKEDADTPMTIDASAPGDVIELSDDFDFDGYQVVRREFFAHTFEPSITFNNYKVYVNTACLNKFPHADCAQLLINRESHILALRPCAESERDAFAWRNTSGGKRKPRQVTGKFFFAKLFELMDWNIDYRYKLLGKVIHANDEYLIAFDLNASEIYQRIAKDGGKPKTARTPVFPAGWKDQFGLPYHEHQKSLQINIFDGYAIYGIKDSSVLGEVDQHGLRNIQAAKSCKVVGNLFPRPHIDVVVLRRKLGDPQISLCVQNGGLRTSTAQRGTGLDELIDPFLFETGLIVFKLTGGFLQRSQAGPGRRRGF